MTENAAHARRGKRSTQRGQQRTVSRLETRLTRPPPQHGELVTQDKDLKIL
jgi:hypothetical protein